ncbi:MAG: RNA polymerase sigma factor [bacterium]
MDFETVYVELFTPLYRYVFFRVRNYDESMDIIQSVFMKVFEKYAHKSKNELEKLLYRSARNEMIDRGVKKKALLVDPSESSWNNIKDESTPNPEHNSIARDNRVLVHKLLEQLPDDDKDIIILRYLQEKEYSEIAVIVGKRESTIRQIVTRSLQKLRKQYEQES